MKKIMLLFWKQNLVLFFIMLGLAISTSLISFSTAEVVNSIVTFTPSIFWKSVLKMVIFYVFFLLFTYLKMRKVSSTIQSMSTHIRGETTKSLINSGFQNFKMRTTETYASWLSNDISQIEQLGFKIFYELISGIVTAVIALFSLVFFHWTLALLTFVEVLLLLQIPKIYKKQIEKKTSEITNQNELFLEKVTDFFNGFSAIYTLKKQDFILNKIIAASLKLGDAKNDHQKTMAGVAITGGIGNVFGQVSIFILTGVLILLKQISIGSIAATGSLTANIFNTMGNVSQYISSINGVAPIFEKLNSIPIESYEPVSIQNNSPLGFSLKDVSYKYGGKPVLNKINYNFEFNKKYAIIGESGSGKSTLLNIMSGKIKDYQGSVMLNNQEISTISYADLFEQMIVIDQKIHLFNTTIRENLVLDDDFSDETIWQALNEVGLKEFVEKLPNQLDSFVGENGNLISGGQAQRIAFARGILRNKNIMLIDEGTSNLDKENSLLIEKNLLAKKNLTLIMITHRLSSTVEAQLDGVLDLNHFSSVNV
ncbi:ABC transporter ATP-binding protein [Enterococcus durans]|uniref:ABC transporter ATP-binding protein n=1 Tax=Enterococcus durans TaxID=53345 RepID=UPI0039A4714F